MEFAAVMALGITLILLILGGFLAYAWGVGEGLAAYLVLFLLSQIGTMMMVIGAILALIFGTVQIRAGVGAYVMFVIVSTIIIMILLMPYTHVTFFPFS